MRRARQQDSRLKIAAAAMRKDLDAADQLDAKSIEDDIAARWHDAQAGRQWADTKSWLAEQKLNLKVWCEKHLSKSVRSMNKRLQLWKEWKTYVDARRKAADQPNRGFDFALLLLAHANRKTNGRTSANHSGYDPDAKLDLSRVQFICGDAAEELKKLKSGSVQCVVCSPPYIGLRDYDHPQQIGHEKTLQAYIRRLVSVFRECWRVMRDDALLWVVEGDVFGRPAGKWHVDPHTRIGARIGNRATNLGGQWRPAIGKRKDLICVADELKRALKGDGWYLRKDIIWAKRSTRPESAKDRPSRSYDHILMFSKSARYASNFAAVAEPREWLEHAHKPGNLPRPGVTRREKMGDYLRGWGDPKTRNIRDVWVIPSFYYKGDHPATFPPELARRCIAASCPPDRECVVLDPFSGAGTTAMVAAQLGQRAIGIELNPKYIKEAKARLKAAPARYRFPHENSVQEHHKRLQNATREKAVFRARWDKVEYICQERDVRAEDIAQISKAIPLRNSKPHIIQHLPEPVQIGGATLYRGDWQDIADTLPAGSVDLLFTDPPFGITKAHWDIPIHINAFWWHALRLVKSTGVILVCAVEPFTAEMIVAQKELYRMRWNWFDDGVPDGFLQSAHQPLKLTEDLLVFSPSGEQFTFNRQPSELAEPKTEWMPMLKSKVHRTNTRFRQIGPRQYFHKHPVNLLFFPRDREPRFMATQKPSSMADYFIATYSNPGDTVLDLFLGSGTFGAAAVQAGRKFIGGDPEKRHFEFARARIAKLIGDGKADRLAAD